MPTRPNAYYNNPAFGAIADNLSAAIFGTPELEGVKLENQRKQMVLDEAYNAQLERGRKQGYEEEFWRQYGEMARGQVAPQGQVDENDPIFKAWGAKPDPVPGTAPGQQTSMLDQIQANPELLQMAVKSGMLDLGDIGKADQAQQLRALMGEQRMAQIEAQIAGRAERGEASDLTRILIADRGNASREAMNVARVNFLYDKLGQERDPTAMAKIQAEIDLLSGRTRAANAQADYTAGARTDLTTAQTANVGADTDLTKAKAANEKLGPGGFKPNEIKAADIEKMTEVVRQQYESRGEELTPEAEQMAVQLALQMQSTGGFPDLGAVMADPRLQRTTSPERFFGMFGGNTQTDVAPGALPASVQPVAPAAPPPAAPVAPAAPIGQPAAADGVVRVRSIEEAMRLPKGTQFLTPDGRLKVR